MLRGTMQLGENQISRNHLGTTAYRDGQGFDKKHSCKVINI